MESRGYNPVRKRTIEYMEKVNLELGKHIFNLIVLGMGIVNRVTSQIYRNHDLRAINIEAFLAAMFSLHTFSICLPRASSNTQETSSKAIIQSILKFTLGRQVVP